MEPWGASYKISTLKSKAKWGRAYIFYVCTQIQMSGPVFRGTWGLSVRVSDHFIDLGLDLGPEGQQSLCQPVCRTSLTLQRLAAHWYTKRDNKYRRTSENCRSSLKTQKIQDYDKKIPCFMRLKGYWVHNHTARIRRRKRTEILLLVLLGCASWMEVRFHRLAPQ